MKNIVLSILLFSFSAHGSSTRKVFADQLVKSSTGATWTLPTADGSSGQTLSTSGAGVMSWINPVITFPSGASGTLGVANGGTGKSTTPTNGQILIGNGTDFTLAGISSISGISVTSGAGSITLKSSYSGTEARYYTTAGPSIASGAFATINFATSSYDKCSPACVTTGASWVYTIPSDGLYSVDAMAWIAAVAWTAGQQAWLRLLKNGSTELVDGPIMTQFNATYFVPVVLKDELYFTTGDTIAIQLFHNRTAGAVTLDTSNTRNRILIRRVGD